MSKVSLTFEVEADVSKDQMSALLLAASESVSRTLMGYRGADGTYVRSISPVDVQTAYK
jgi:uncharacterized OsmC-like protein